MLHVLLPHLSPNPALIRHVEKPRLKDDRLQFTSAEIDRKEREKRLRAPARPEKKMAGIDRRDCGPDLTLSLATGARGADSLPKSDAAAKQQAMTIFYEGRVRVFHATETQAQAIISMAKRGMEEETSKTTRKESVDSSTLSQPLPPPPPPVLQSGLSMKRSLLRFLQKRKARIHEAAPYIREDKFMPLLPIKLQQV